MKPLDKVQSIQEVESLHEAGSAHEDYDDNEPQTTKNVFITSKPGLPK